MGIMHERVMSLIPTKRGGVKEFAEKIGVPANLVSMWRKGDSVSYKNYLPQISGAYNVSIDWLCGNEEQKENPTVSGEGLDPVTKELFDIVEAASDSERQMMLEMLKVLKRGGK